MEFSPQQPSPQDFRSIDSSLTLSSEEVRIRETAKRLEQKAAEQGRKYLDHRNFYQLQPGKFLITDSNQFVASEFIDTLYNATFDRVSTDTGEQESETADDFNTAFYATMAQHLNIDPSQAPRLFQESANNGLEAIKTLLSSVGLPESSFDEVFIMQNNLTKKRNTQGVISPFDVQQLLKETCTIGGRYKAELFLAMQQIAVDYHLHQQTYDIKTFFEEYRAQLIAERTTEVPASPIKLYSVHDAENLYLLGLHTEGVLPEKIHYSDFASEAREQVVKELEFTPGKDLFVAANRPGIDGSHFAITLREKPVSSACLKAFFKAGDNNENVDIQELVQDQMGVKIIFFDDDSIDVRLKRFREAMNERMRRWYGKKSLQSGKDDKINDDEIEDDHIAFIDDSITESGRGQSKYRKVLRDKVLVENAASKEVLILEIQYTNADSLVNDLWDIGPLHSDRIKSPWLDTTFEKSPPCDDESLRKIVKRGWPDDQNGIPLGSAHSLYVLRRYSKLITRLPHGIFEGVNVGECLEKKKDDVISHLRNQNTVAIWSWSDEEVDREDNYDLDSMLTFNV